MISSVLAFRPSITQNTVWGPILGTFKHYSRYCDSAKLSRQNLPVYTVATYSQHYKTSNIFTSRVVFAILRPISVALSRHQFWAVCDPIMGSVAGALQSQKDALAHRALLTREQSSIENDVGIQVTHLLVLCHLTDEKLNKTTINSGNLLFWHRIWTISTWVFTRSKYKQILCK